MADPKFFEADNHTLTVDATLLLEWLDATCDVMEAEAAKGDGITAINQRHGPIKEYYVHVRKMKSLTGEEYIRNFSKSLALNAWRVMEAVDDEAEKQAQVQEAADGVANLTKGQQNIVDALEAMKAELATVKAQLAESEAKRKPGRPPKAQPEPEPDSETPDEGESNEEA